MLPLLCSGLYTEEEIESDKPVVDTDELTEEKLAEEVLELVHYLTMHPAYFAVFSINFVRTLFKYPSTHEIRILLLTQISFILLGAQVMILLNPVLSLMTGC